MKAQKGGLIIRRSNDQNYVVWVIRFMTQCRREKEFPDTRRFKEILRERFPEIKDGDLASWARWYIKEKEVW